MLGLRLPLRLLIAREARDRAANSPAHTVADALAEIAELALRLLSLALGILLLALLLETLGADEAADGLLACTDCLVPAAGLTVRVVGCDARGADGDAADVAARL